MLSENEFEVLLERYEDDPAVCSRLLRTHSLSDPSSFLPLAQAAILRRPPSRALKSVAGLAIAGGIVPALLELCAKNRSEALTLAKKISQMEPRIDLALAEHVLRPAAEADREESVFHSVLDILETISEGDFLVPTILKLLKHPNPKVRSKAALFIGSRTQNNVTWAATRSQEWDPRVRANMLESLFGLNSPFVLQMFRSHAGDENNRVAGNAALGMYLAGEAESIPLICNLAKHADSRFRNTGAWVMGQTADPRFVGLLSELLNDTDEIVRSQAFRALREIKKVMREAGNRPQLAVALGKIQRCGSVPSTAATVIAGGQPVRGLTATSFVLKAGTPPRVVRHFSVEEADRQSSINIAFIMCLPAENEAAVAQRFKRAVVECLSLRRSKDRWTILKISGNVVRSGVAETSSALGRYWQKQAILSATEQAESTGAVAEVKLEYSAHQHRIHAMLAEDPIRLTDNEAGDAQLLMKLLTRIDNGGEKTHLVFLGAGRPRVIEHLEASGREMEPVVHLVSESQLWNTPRIREICENSGGSATFCAPEEVAEACKNLNSSLLHHYTISSPELTDPLELDVHSPKGEGSSRSGLVISPPSVAV